PPPVTSATRPSRSPAPPRNPNHNPASDDSRRSPATTGVAEERHLLAPQHGPGHEILAEGGEDGQVQQPGGGHDGRVPPFPQRRLHHEQQHHGGDRRQQPDPAQ